MLKNLSVIKGDIHFQWKYGFYFIYLILVLIYSGILALMPAGAKSAACDILTYSDPAAMGMFFMGAIVLLEKSQRVLNSIAVAPVTANHYLIGKICSIGLISLIVGLCLVLQVRSEHILSACIGIFTASVCFTLCGIIVGTKINSLTGYIVGTIPIEFIGFIPPILLRLNVISYNPLILLHPGCAQIQLISGECSDITYALLSCMVWIVLLYIIAYRSVNKMLCSVGGVKL